MSDEPNPEVEPDNSTFDDWHGQEVAADEKRADRLIEETGGDLEEAERRYDQEAEAAHKDDDDVPQEERPT
ncbi:hypothetical protein BH24ACT3_BH24ACT3_02960 [soil metagenome]